MTQVASTGSEGPDRLFLRMDVPCSQYRHVLVSQQADTNAEARAVARKLMNWIAHHGVTPSQHRDRLFLLYQHLDELGLSEELKEINYYGTTFRLSVRQKLLRRGPEEESLRRQSSFPKRTAPLLSVKAMPSGCSASLRSLDTAQLARFLVFKPD